MAKIITNKDWDEVWEESEKSGKMTIQSKEFETIEKGNNKYVCNRYTCETQLRNGLWVRIHEEDFVDDIIWKRDSFDDYQFGLSFFISGKVKIQRHGLTDEIEELVGRYYSECNCDIPETEWWQAGDKFYRIYIGIEPKEFFQSFSEAEFEQIPIAMRQGIVGGKQQPYYHLGKITKRMQQSLRDILHCPYQGLMKRMFLESRAIDLITLHFQQVQDRNVNKNNYLSKDLSDIERIHQAKEILLKNLENPPSLIELARQVGLNEFKLKRGFHQVFGTSAFKYLHEYRLEQAWQLLANGEIKVEEVASRVGFESRSYFAVAFRKKFGLNPKQFRQNPSSVQIKKSL